MRNPILVFLLLAWTTLAAPVVVEGEDGVSPPDLTPYEFGQMKGTYFVKFFSPYCAHCKAFAPKWDAAYKAAGGPDSKALHWANVDCIQFGDLCGSQSIRSYPTLRVYRDGQNVYEFTTKNPSEHDLVYFAEQYALLGEKVLAVEYEAAPEQNLVAGALPGGQPVEKPVAQPVQPAAQPVQPIEPVQPVQPIEPVQPVVEAVQEPVVEAQPAEPAEIDSSQSTTEAGVVKWHGTDIDPARAVGRWLVLFTSLNCDACQSLVSKWENHGNFARDVVINWALVDCSTDSEICEKHGVQSVPVIRVYDDGANVYQYDGPTHSANLRSLVKHVADARNFENFNLPDLEATAQSQGDEGSGGAVAGPADEPQYMEGPVARKPEYKGRPKIADVVKYTLDTLGQPLDADPGKLIFGDSPEAHHNFRTWSAPNAPPPPFVPLGSLASYADGKVAELTSADFDKVVRQSGEPWLIDFYSPKCPHCTKFAPTFAETALKLKGKVNVGKVDCEANSKLCDGENVRAWPTIMIYRGEVPIDPFEGTRSVPALLQYAERSQNAQIYPLDGQQHLVDEIVANMDSNTTTYVYLYDESVMAEDWQSLSTVASNIAAFGGKLYRSNDAGLRELAGISHRGSAFVNVDLSGDTVTGQLKWYDYPFSNIPKKIRDAAEVTRWAYRAKWSSLQYLDPEAVTEFSPYVAVLLTNGTKKPSNDAALLEHKKMALEFRDHYRERQIQDQDRMRVDRLKQHDAALARSDFVRAKKLMQQPLDNSVSVDLAFAYVPYSVWKAQYGHYVDAQKHEPGNVIVVDFYNGDYLDEFNLLPIKDNMGVLEDSAELLHRYTARDAKTSFKSVRKFKHSMAGIPKPNHRSTHFHFKTRSQDWQWRLVKVLAVFVIAYVVYRRFLRARLRGFVARQHQRDAEENVFSKRD